MSLTNQIFRYPGILPTDIFHCMTSIELGLHECLITKNLAESIDQLDKSLHVNDRVLRKEEAGDRLALHMSRCLLRAIEDIPPNDRLERGAELTQRVIEEIHRVTKGSDYPGDALSGEPKVLHAVTRHLPNGQPDTILEPLTPLLDTTLLTNAPGEPRVGQELSAEINSADRIDVVMAFVRYSGIRPLLDGIRQHTANGKTVRLLTTVYTGSTEARALDALVDAGVSVLVSYDTGRTRLHAKAWLFHRNSGFSTAYIGSSNLTHMAQVDGLEWNVRVSAARNPDVIDKVRAVFESYWQDGDFIPYDADDFAAHMQSERRSDNILLPPTEIHALPFQARLLEQIAVSRMHGFHRNLLVAATGTGKTVMAALDYASLVVNGKRPSLLFVAHRKEILTQALATFRHAFRDATFGELWVGGAVPDRYEHVFASIQTLSKETLQHFARDKYKVVIVDEFHHAAASSYQRLLEHVTPEELLGLTATPERSDGLSVLDSFDGRIAAELRLWDAIDQQRLTPFAYFGVADGTNLKDVPWRRGRGYDVEGLTNVLTADDSIARRVLQSLRDHVQDIQTIHGLGFCVSVQHARFMARVFSEAGLASLAIWADTPPAEREQALHSLSRGEIRILFSVDLFNEGVDIPSVDTLLMLRPTESGTLFLQQLGRGLRHHQNKRICTVLDFVGQHRQEFRFDRRYRALLGGTRKYVQKQVQTGFPFLPAGCHLSLDAVASSIILNSLKQALPSTWNAKVNELTSMSAQPVTLQSFLDESGLDLEDIYAGNRCWSDLREAAKLDTAPEGEHESKLRRAIGRLLHVNDDERLKQWSQWLSDPDNVNVDALPIRLQRLLRMLVASLVDQACDKDTSLADGWRILIDHPQICIELIELFDVLRGRVLHLQSSLECRSNIPLNVHARYTRLEILAASGIGSGAKVSPWQTGCYRVQEIKVDLLAFTLDKTDGGFSPTTRYRDYAISRELIHWESQNVTRSNSETGLRYQQHRNTDDEILLFARNRSDDRSFWFLGPADYVSHEGERPMAINWRLKHALPGDLYVEFAAAVA